jgi:hypothetical protein
MVITIMNWLIQINHMVVSMNNISIIVITDSLMKTILIKSEMNFLALWGGFRIILLIQSSQVMSLILHSFLEYLNLFCHSRLDYIMF